MAGRLAAREGGAVQEKGGWCSDQLHCSRAVSVQVFTYVQRVWELTSTEAPVASCIMFQGLFSVDSSLAGRPAEFKPRPAPAQKVAVIRVSGALL